jgi:hypothetical protein
MKKLFLKAKHWQLFILMFVIPFLIQMTMLFMVIISAFTAKSSGQAFAANYMRCFSLCTMLYCMLMFGWFWFVTMGLQHKIPQELKFKLVRFKVFFFIPIVYIICIMFFMQMFMAGLNKGVPDIGFIFSMIGIMIPMHLFSMFCMIHTMYFVAKTIKTVELQRKVTFTDFVGEFFLVWFLPIGLWILQPQINKMIEDK